ncbi:MAG: hypothetical protein ACJAZX_000094 [Rickettsiales bacterium]|jgi:hypothetical protein
MPITTPPETILPTVDSATIKTQAVKPQNVSKPEDQRLFKDFDFGTSIPRTIGNNFAITEADRSHLGSREAIKSDSFVGIERKVVATPAKEWTTYTDQKTEKKVVTGKTKTIISNTELSPEAVFQLSLQVGLVNNETSRKYLSEIGLASAKNGNSDVKEGLSRFGINLEGGTITFNEYALDQLTESLVKQDDKYLSDNTAKTKFKNNLSTLLENLKAIENSGDHKNIKDKKKFKAMAHIFTLVQTQERLQEERDRLLDVTKKLDAVNAAESSVASLKVNGFFEKNEVEFNLEACRRNITGLERSVESIVKSSEELKKNLAGKATNDPDLNSKSAKYKIIPSDIGANHDKDIDIVLGKKAKNAHSVIREPFAAIFKGVLFGNNPAKLADYVNFGYEASDVRERVADRLQKYPDIKGGLEAFSDLLELTPQQNKQRRDSILAGMEQNMSKQNEETLEELDKKLTSLKQNYLDNKTASNDINEQLQAKLLFQAILLLTPLVGIDIAGPGIDFLIGIFEQVGLVLNTEVLGEWVDFCASVLSPLAVMNEEVNTGGLLVPVLAVVASEALLGNPIAQKINNMEKEGKDLDNAMKALRKAEKDELKGLSEKQKEIRQEMYGKLVERQKDLFVAAKTGKWLEDQFEKNPETCKTLINNIFEKDPKQAASLIKTLDENLKENDPSKKKDLGALLSNLQQNPKQKEIFENLVKVSSKDDKGKNPVIEGFLSLSDIGKQFTSHALNVEGRQHKLEDGEKATEIDKCFEEDSKSETGESVKGKIKIKDQDVVIKSGGRNFKVTWTDKASFEKELGNLKEFDGLKKTLDKKEGEIKKQIDGVKYEDAVKPLEDAFYLEQAKKMFEDMHKDKPDFESSKSEFKKELTPEKAKDFVVNMAKFKAAEIPSTNPHAGNEAGELGSHLNGGEVLKKGPMRFFSSITRGS